MRIQWLLRASCAVWIGTAAGLISGCNTLPDALNPPQAELTESAQPVSASGFLEAEEVSVVAETGGLVLEVMAEEGQPVTAGQTVIRLDDSLLLAEKAQAEAAVRVAQAHVEQLRAGASDEELAAAQAALDEAAAAVKGAQYAAGSAWAAANNPQSIAVQIEAARTQAELALRQVELARVQLEEAQIKLGWLRTVPENERDLRAIEFQEYTVQILEAQVRAAEAQYQGAQRKVELLEEQRERPLSAIAQARASQAQVGIAEARVELAQARYDLVLNGALPEEIAIAQAQVDLAEAQVALIDAQIARLTLTAPIDGIVAMRAIHAGETAAPGVPLLTISDLSTLKLVIYIPETQMGQVRLGDRTEISVDAYPGDVFEGIVTFLSREAEFTPRNVQTEEDRVSLVFAIEIQIDNADGRLKPGMPADAVIAPAD